MSRVARDGAQLQNVFNALAHHGHGNALVNPEIGEHSIIVIAPTIVKQDRLQAATET